jgi:hypothetical protein
MLVDFRELTVLNINLVLLIAWHSMAQILKDKPPLPLPLVPIHFPKADVDKRGLELLGSTIRYHDGKNGKIMECTIDDFGTSHLKGDWFLVTYDDDTAFEITASDMNDILKNRVD